MDFGILGPVRVADENGEIKISGAKPRAALALLLLHDNRPVAISQLVDALWADDPPENARMAVQGHIKRLRQMLGQKLAAHLETTPSGYRLAVADGDLDLRIFQTLVRSGRSAAAVARWDEAAAALAEALALWRGEPLQDVPPSPHLCNETERLTELRLQTLEWRIDADMRTGRYAELVAELRQLVAAYPLQERFHGQLMVALHRCGRQAEALTAFHLARSALVEELGVEPGIHLKELHRQILQADEPPDLPPTVPAPGPVTEGKATVSFRSPGNQLPADIRDFTGREAEVASLLSTLDGVTPPAMIIAGAGGVGKTALAIHVAHQAAHRYPDGQLFLPLHGSGRAPALSNSVLGRTLRALGADHGGIPRSEEERAALYRSVLAGRRMLIILDDAASTEQVSALLPGVAGSAVLVTTRHCTLGVDGARWVFLQDLPRQHSRSLIGHIVGQDRAAAEPQAVDELAHLCADLPLAVRIASTQLVVRPSWTVEGLVRRMAEDGRRLQVLGASGHRDRLALALGHGNLCPALTRAFRLLAATNVRRLSIGAIGAMLDTCLDESRQLAELLVDRHLLCSAGQNHYRYRDLQYLYAREEVRSAEPKEGVTAARRLTAHYLSLLQEASQSTRDAERDIITALIADNSGWPVSDAVAVAQLRQYVKPCVTAGRAPVPVPATTQTGNGFARPIDLLPPVLGEAFPA